MSLLAYLDVHTGLNFGRQWLFVGGRGGENGHTFVLGCQAQSAATTAAAYHTSQNFVRRRHYSGSNTLAGTETKSTEKIIKKKKKKHTPTR